ncbi:helix-turn-helix domain-containing protein [Faecalibacterium prausnitzii]|jgi:excisionase family DNA binding protein|uniref:helix-turn-helix domain-containing protein n=1 Tax=Faecalibacterium prausnitzii TaxID=853 RepID=UPI0022E6821F|nr:helix-turn-helix domain-containing protein [Faecalibacterium prausnitzii]
MKEQKIPLEQQLVYNVEEVATILKTTRPVVYSLIEKGYLPSIVLGRRKVTRKALLTFLDKNENTNFSQILKSKQLS